MHLYPSGEFSIIYTNAQGGTEQTEGKDRWTKRFTAKKGQFLYISAQNQRKYGDITVQILLDGQPWRSSKSSGAYVIATCSGRADTD